MTFTVDGGIEWENITTTNPRKLTIRPAETPEAGYSVGQMKDFASSSNVPWGRISARNHQIIIEEGVLNIGTNAFYYGTGITQDLMFPDSVKSIGRFAFYYCSNLKGNVTIGKNVVYIGEGAFNGCKIPGYLSFNDGLEIIDQSAFANCNIVGTVTIPATVTTIGMMAFQNCPNIDCVTFLGDKPDLGINSLNVTTDTTSTKTYLMRSSGWASRETIDEKISPLRITWDFLPLEEEKKLRFKVAGEWKDGVPYVKVNGEWKIGVPYIKVNGQWKQAF